MTSEGRRLTGVIPVIINGGALQNQVLIKSVTGN
jgi:hypothetical protein